MGFYALGLEFSDMLGYKEGHVQFVVRSRNLFIERCIKVGVHIIKIVNASHSWIVAAIGSCSETMHSVHQ
jgi:hypothetical protein